MTNHLPTLYSFRRCPYAIRARMALAAAGIAVTLHEVALRDKPAALLLASPKGTVPVLVLPDGRVIDESLDIMRWALGHGDPLGWLREADDPRAASWLHRNDALFKPLLDRYKYAPRFPELSQPGHRALAVAALVDPLDVCLREDAFVLGDRPSWVDVAVFPFVRQFTMVEPAWFDLAPWPGLHRWLGYWLQHGLYAAVMDKQGAWAAPTPSNAARAA